MTLSVSPEPTTTERSKAMHHLEIELEEQRARRAEAAMAHLRRRSPLGGHWGDENDGDGAAAEHGNSWAAVLDEFDEAFNQILYDADREARELDRTADYYLEAAASEMADRAASRDAVDGERSMARAVAAFNTLYGHELSETEGWQFMSILKKSRSARGAYREDDHTDDVAYAALAAESAWGNCNG
jgi:hypothetical protein